jgi:hypothetical protein
MLCEKNNSRKTLMGSAHLSIHGRFIQAHFTSMMQSVLEQTISCKEANFENEI